MKTVKVSEVVSQDLALRDSANVFFDYLESISESNLSLDFKRVASISRSFAHQYLTRKSTSFKTITELNVPLNVKKMLDAVQKPTPKWQLIDLHLLKPIKV